MASANAMFEQEGEPSRFEYEEKSQLEPGTYCGALLRHLDISVGKFTETSLIVRLDGRLAVRDTPWASPMKYDWPVSDMDQQAWINLIMDIYEADYQLAAPPVRSNRTRFA